MKLWSRDQQYKDQLRWANVKEIKELKSIKIKGMKTIKDKVYLYRSKSDTSIYPVFIKVMKIFLCEYGAILFGRLIFSDGFDRKKNSFEVYFDSNVILFNPLTIEFHENCIFFKNDNVKSFI